MNTISFLRNPIQEYAWGSKTAIQSLLKMPVPGTTPAAELWMGVHPKGSSEVCLNSEWLSLVDVIEKNPEPILGKKVAERFQNQLPFLFKVLAADRPLSIQVHPDPVQAQEGYATENRRNIPLTAPDRNYRDPNHKPEVLCAVTPFEALKGFRKIEDIVALMSKVCIPELAEPLHLLKRKANPEGLKEFFLGLFQMSFEKKARVIRQAVRRAQDHVNRNRAFYWMDRTESGIPKRYGGLFSLDFQSGEPATRPGDLYPRG